MPDNISMDDISEENIWPLSFLGL